MGDKSKREVLDVKAVQPMRSGRRFRWISSVHGDPALLNDLHERMMAFYSRPELRGRYQAMLDAQDDAVDQDSAPGRLLKYIVEICPKRVVEVGCGNGRLYRQLRSHGWEGEYMGIEPGVELVGANRARHPEADWREGSAYAIPVPDGSVDIVFSVYVLEHLIFPARALAEMRRAVAPTGRVVLLFPDFTASGRFGSQLLGLSPGTARSKAARGRWIDALISLFDSRWRLPRALRCARHRVGPFPVNLAPLCLDWPGFMDADVDAVYAASKDEVAGWGKEHGLDVTFPAGTGGLFAEHAFVVFGPHRQPVEL